MPKLKWGILDKKFIKIAKNGQFGEFLKTWNLRSNSVTRQVTFYATKIVGKWQNRKIEMRHFWWFLNTAQDLENLKPMRITWANCCLRLLLYSTFIRYILLNIIFECSRQKLTFLYSMHYACIAWKPRLSVVVTS